MFTVFILFYNFLTCLSSITCMATSITLFETSVSMPLQVLNIPSKNWAFLLKSWKNHMCWVFLSSSRFFLPPSRSFANRSQSFITPSISLSLA